MKIGILGAGSIAGILARTMNRIDEVELYAIGSRNLEKAQKFAEEYGVQVAYGSYEELVEDPQVELVYVASPHSHHYEHMKLCVEHGKHVLCEKAFTVNKQQAEDICALAREKGVYVAEAIWTRYMPSRKLIDEVIASGIIGQISIATANLSYDIDGVERIVKPELAGGALLDVGVYGLNFLTMHLGKEVERVESAMQRNEYGVDARESITLFFKDGTMAVTTHGIYGRSDRKGIFYGEKGYIIVENINNPREINVFDNADNLIRHIDVPKTVPGCQGNASGYEYEIIEAIRCIEAGKVECESMPHEESIYLMGLMDRVRDTWK